MCFVRPIVCLVFRRRNMCILPKFVSAKPPGGGGIRPHTHFHPETLSFLLLSPRPFFGIMISKHKPQGGIRPHTHFHPETWSFLGLSPRPFFGIMISKHRPHVNEMFRTLETPRVRLLLTHDFNFQDLLFHTMVGIYV